METSSQLYTAIALPSVSIEEPIGWASRDGGIDVWEKSHLLQPGIEPLILWAVALIWPDIDNS
jgi:hypothetical protein